MFLDVSGCRLGLPTQYQPKRARPPDKGATLVIVGPNISQL